MKSRVPFLALGLGLGACGPTEREVGSLVLFALPIMVLIGALVQVGYRALWHRAVLGEAASPLDHRTSKWILGISAGLWAVSLINGFAGEAGIVAVWLVGATYLAYLLIAMRATIHADRWYARAGLVPFLLLAPFALNLAVAGSTTSEAELSAYYFVMPGYLGIVPGGILALWLIEIAIRGSRRRSAEREVEPVFPEARVLSDLDQVTPKDPEKVVARS